MKRIKKYRKWIFLGLGIWGGLYGVFWSTAEYAYSGFIVAILILVLAAFLTVKYRNSRKTGSRKNE